MAKVEVLSPQIYIPKASRLLTEDLRFNYNPQEGVVYPRNPQEYQELMSRILDHRGRFPGDTEALTAEGTFASEIRGVKHYSLKRRGVQFDVEIIAPNMHAQRAMNRVIFDADLISQIASFDTYGTPRVMYDREFYYVGRIFNAEKVSFIRLKGWPVSFAAVKGYRTTYKGRDLYYAFIHFAMTVGQFQGYGLAFHSVRKGLSSLFYSNLWNHCPNLMCDTAGNLHDYRFRLWVAAHSGRFVPFYSFATYLNGIDPSWLPIAQAITLDVHKRITPAEELSRGEPIAEVKQVNGHQFAVAADRGVYPPHNRYPEKNGRIVFPQREQNLSSSIWQAWLDVIGGDTGIIAGNGLYFVGCCGFGNILAAKKRERQKAGRLLERLDKHIRGVGNAPCKHKA